MAGASGRDPDERGGFGREATPSPASTPERLFESAILPLVDRVLEAVTDLRRTLPERLSKIETAAALRDRTVEDHEARLRALERATGKGKEENALVRKIVFGALSALVLVVLTTVLNYAIATVLGLVQR